MVPRQSEVPSPVSPYVWEPGYEQQPSALSSYKHFVTYVRIYDFPYRLVLSRTEYRDVPGTTGIP